MGQFEADRSILVIAVPLIVILAGLAGWLLNRRSLTPVLEMSRQAHRIGVNNLGERLPVVNPRDELGLLAATFNDLLSRLAAALDGQRKFMADASHELRTPVSVIRTIASVNLARTGRTEQEYREALEVIDAHSRRLSRMVEDLLNLARADSGQFAPLKTPMHLDDMILETVQAVSVLARDKTIRLEVGEMPEEEAAFVGDEDLLRQMVLNLLDNAIKYTPSPGTVRVGMEYADGHWLIRVVDSGRGIPTEAQARIFERFYRGNPGEKQGGAGLGLSIAQWIAQLHGGVLELERSGPQGSSFLAKLPAAPQT
jgi:signal transduction histidine kinase